MPVAAAASVQTSAYANARPDGVTSTDALPVGDPFMVPVNAVGYQYAVSLSLGFSAETGASTRVDNIIIDTSSVEAVVLEGDGSYMPGTSATRQSPPGELYDNSLQVDGVRILIRGFFVVEDLLALTEVYRPLTDGAADTAGVSDGGATGSLNALIASESGPMPRRLIPGRLLLPAEIAPPDSAPLHLHSMPGVNGFLGVANFHGSAYDAFLLNFTGVGTLPATGLPDGYEEAVAASGGAGNGNGGSTARRLSARGAEWAAASATLDARAQQSTRVSASTAGGSDTMSGTSAAALVAARAWKVVSSSVMGGTHSDAPALSARHEAGILGETRASALAAAASDSVRRTQTDGSGEGAAATLPPMGLAALDFQMPGSGVDSSLQFNGIAREYAAGVQWGERSQRGGDSPWEAPLFSPSVCGVDLFGGVTSSWRMILDSSAVCLTLPAELFDSLMSWLPAECDHAASMADASGVTPPCKVPASVPLDAEFPWLQFSLSEGGEPLYIPLRTHVVPDATGVSGTAPTLTNRYYCVLRAMSIQSVVASNEPDNTLVVFGSLAMRALYAVLSSVSTRVGLVSKAYHGPATSIAAVAGAGRDAGEALCGPKAACVGDQQLRVSLNECVDPDCSAYSFQLLDLETMTCVMDPTWEIAGAALLACMVLLEVCCFRVHTACQRSVDKRRNRRLERDTFVSSTVDVVLMRTGRVLDRCRRRGGGGRDAGASQRAQVAVAPL